MNIRQQAIACASACLLCVGPGVAAAQTSPEDPYGPQHQQEQTEQQRQHEQQRADMQQGQQQQRAQQGQQQQRAQQGQQQQRAQQGQQQQQAQQGQQQQRAQQGQQQQGQQQARGQNLFASLDREQRREVQRQLEQAGHYQGDIDGIYGPMTQAALRDYQEQRNIQATGRLDNETARALGVEVSQEIQPVAGTTGESNITDRGRQVRLAQQALAREGFHDGAVDGLLGPVTEQSIRDFQRAQGLRVTGDLNQQTREALGIRGQQGQQGMQAPQGQQGMQAPQGQQGMQAPQGQQGTQAPQGQQGTQAPQGQQGTQAPQGQQGMRAPQGQQRVSPEDEELFEEEGDVFGDEG